MKFRSVFLLAIFVSLVFATDNDGYNPIASTAPVNTQDTDEVSLTIVNSFEAGQQVLGLDSYSAGTSNYILGVCRNNSEVITYDLAGTITGTIALDASNTNCFGYVWNDSPSADIHHTNDWVNTNLFTTENFGSSWTTSLNPATYQGRGMDFDGTYYWETTLAALWRFQPGSAAIEIPVIGIPGPLTGLTTFPYGANLGIAVTTYNIHNIYFFEWDGSSLSSLGYAACPGTNISSTGSYGLTYNPTTGSMFWSYKNTSDEFFIVEFTFSITSLERSSWGSIKSIF